MESVRPITALGSVKEKMGDVESALALFESALEYLDVAEASGHCRGDSGQRGAVELRLRNIKQKMGLISPSEEVAQLRQELKQLMHDKAHIALIAMTKQQLAGALLAIDPPQYFEAVKLMKEAAAVFAQVFGPENEMSTKAKEFYDIVRQEYMLYLQDIAKNGKEQT